MSSSLDFSLASMTPTEQAAAYVDRLFGTRSGIVVVALGLDGYFDDKGTYGFAGPFEHSYFDWPYQRQDLIDGIVKRGPLHDVYIIPTLRSEDHPRKGACLGSQHCWADIDDVTEAALERLVCLQSVGSFVVHSGQGLHVYLALDAVYDSQVIEDLNKLLVRFLSADKKWAENSLLRPAGTSNKKGTARGSSSYPVTFEDIEGSQILPWNPERLQDVLQGNEPLDPNRKASRARVRRAARPAPQASEELIPVEPEPLENVPDDLARILNGAVPIPNRSSGDRSRSGRLYELVGFLILQGYFDGQVMALCLDFEPAKSKWPDEERRAQEIQRCINKLRPKHDHEGLKCRQAGCGRRSRQEVFAKLADIRFHFETSYRARTLSTDTKVLEAFLELASEIGDLEFDVSQRDLCLRSSVGSRKTLRNSLDRLVTAGYLIHRHLKNGKPVRKGKVNPTARSHRYRLTCPDDNFEPHLHKRLRSVECGSKLPILDPGHDIWRHKGGLSSAYPTFRALVERPMTIEELADFCGRPISTITRHIRKKLFPVGLVDEKPNGSWVALETSVDVVADEIGVTGMGASQSRRHDLERKGFERYLRRHRNIEDVSFESAISDFDLVKQGHVWIPRHLVVGGTEI